MSKYKETIFMPSETGTIIWNGTEYELMEDYDINDAAQQTDAMLLEDIEKGRKRKFSTRAEAAAYASNIRWANNRAEGGGNEPPHMKEMRLEAEALRGEMDILNQTVSFEDMQRSSLRITNQNNPQAWKDEKGDIQINSSNNEMIPSPKVADLHDRVISLGNKMHNEALDRTEREYKDGKFKTTEEAHAAYAGHMKAVVGEVRPIGGSIEVAQGPNTSNQNFAPIQTSLVTVASTMPTDWSEGSKGAKIQLDSDPMIPNGSFQPPSYVGQAPVISIPTPDVIGKRFNKDTLGVVGHEYTHFVEYRRPAVRAMEVAFMTHRTTGFSQSHMDGSKSAPSLRSRIKSTKKDARVYAKSSGGQIMQIDRDQFQNLYSGRRYDSATKTLPPYSRPNNSRGGFFELMTTGFEQVLSGNRDKFDPDHLSFVLGVMATA